MNRNKVRGSNHYCIKLDIDQSKQRKWVNTSIEIITNQLKGLLVCLTQNSYSAYDS